MSSTANQFPVRRIQFIGRLSFIAGLVVAGCLIFGGPNQPRERSDARTPADSAEHLVSLASSQPTPTANRSVGTRLIEEIRVGDRVLARNPEVTDAERAQWQEPDWSEWIHLSLVLPKEDGSELKIEMLRPEPWVLEQVSYIFREQEATQTNLAPLAPNLLGGEGLGVRGNARGPSPPTPLPENGARGARLDKSPNQETTEPENDADLVPLSPLRPIYRDVALTAAVLDAAEAELIGLTVEMDLPEMGAFGTAVVTDISPCPPIQAGKGQPVTATFSHPPSTQVLDVRFEGETDSIGVTDNHLFWSVDRQQFIPIGQMEIGEQVQTYSGHTKRIAGQLPRPGPQLVYNLEVYGEHVYFVGEQGLLAHNAYQAPSGGANSIFRGDSALNATTNAKGINKSFIDGSGNLVPASTSGIYKGRQVSVAEHVLGGFRRGAKGNSPFTSLTPNATTAAGYGTDVIGVNVSALRKAIRSGEVTGVAVLKPKQVQRLIRNNPNLSDYWKNLSSKWAARDGEFLIRGTVPQRFITGGGQ